MNSEETDVSCAICEERKEKRFCPEVHGKICPQCCGEQREVTLDCPSDCPYLLQAREHATAHHANPQNEWPGERDREALFREVEIPDVEITEQFLYEREELILGLSFALAKCAREELPNAGELQPHLRAANCQLGAPDDCSRDCPRSRDHGQGISRGRAATYRPYAAAGFRRAEGAGIPLATGLGTHVRQAEVAGVRRFPLCAVPRKGIGHRRARRGREPHRYSVGSDSATLTCTVVSSVVETSLPQGSQSGTGESSCPSWLRLRVQSRRTVCPPASPARSSSAVFPSPGWRASGAISTSGCRTNRRWCIAGCGIFKPGSSTTRSPNRTRSISILRAPFSRMRRRPIAASTRNASWSSSLGVLSVSIAAMQFKNQGWSGTSTGWVSYNAETANNRPATSNCAIAACKLAARSPRFDPSDRYAV